MTSQGRRVRRVLKKAGNGNKTAGTRKKLALEDDDTTGTDDVSPSPSAPAKDLLSDSDNQENEELRTPQEGEGTPQEEEGPPQKEKGAPEEKEGAPQEEKGAPQNEEGAPQEENGVPQEEKGGPQEKKNTDVNWKIEELKEEEIK